MRHIDWGLGVFKVERVRSVSGRANRSIWHAVYQDLLAAGQLAGYEVPEPVL